MSDFPYELDKELEETVMVRMMKPEINDDMTVTIKAVDVPVKQKVVYTDPVAQRLTCPPGEHYWYMYNNTTYEVRCKHCLTAKFVYPVTYDLQDGKLIHRDTGNVL